MSKQRFETIPCAFCKGQGTDPYNVMSPLSTCTVCDGKCYRRVPVPHVRCAYCQGTGSGKTYSCPVCEGAGVLVQVPEPTRPCPDCRGRAFEASSGLPCLGCKGCGVVTVAAPVRPIPSLVPIVPGSKV
jgi:RecJ-like exonuclease